MSTIWSAMTGERQQEVLDRWLEAGLGLFREKMSPGTPVAEALGDAMTMVLTGCGRDDARCGEGISRITRILAVQPFPPSRSLGLFRELHEILLEKVSGAAEADELRRCIEEITFQAFDRFMEHRETIYQLKVEETRSNLAMLLRRQRT
ncbi:hypothetical protein INT08_05365 [Prosthecochloris sp. N3]|uniref:RsbT co-antagonist protein RsbRD N-terminal domain-containing protein n=1 Tax=Prosthecochloris ethylica TaxID=2743976 RepID=A0ABR9XRK1_9CHLB|nr:hypothetical protein [Prosthecochloris ethylica]MBF0585991.1 hypothetical protein [Prosthecochloris ethylica]MBF0636609.1 hypothetical protein [Prosthecochloris ethylica]MEC9487194.1 hypothetical protein [Prosthecochloris sp.]NUK47241.1 hypothetical protein [Prosthecochloris ethylica]